MAEYWKNGQKYIIPDLTPEELAEVEARRQAAEREYWANISYDEAVSIEFRKQYSQDRVEAIVNNFLSDMTNPLFVQEMQEMQSYRAECKAYVKSKKGVI